MAAVSLAVLEHESDGPEVHVPLVIAHGLFGSARNFNTLGRKLAGGRRVVMVDMRNHGDSPWAGDTSYEAMAEDLAAVVRDRCGGHAVVLGHSMGGKAVMALALTRPEGLAGAIVADIAPVRYTHSHLSIIHAMQALPLDTVTRRSQGSEMLAGSIPDRSLRAFILQNLVVDGEGARWRLNVDALEAGMGDLIGWPEALDAARFGGPLLALYGGASEYMTDLLRPRVRELFPRAEFSVLPGAGHWLHAEQPDAFVGAVADWLATLD